MAATAELNTTDSFESSPTVEEASSKAPMLRKDQRGSPVVSLAALFDVLKMSAALALVAVFLSTGTLWLGFVALGVGINGLVRVLLSRLRRVGAGRLVPPYYTHGELGSFVGALVSVAVVLPRVQSRFWQVLLLLLAVAGFLQGARMLILFLLSAVVRLELGSDFRRGVPPRLRLPHILVLSDGYVSERTLGPWLLQLSRTLWSTRQQSADTRPPGFPQKSNDGWAGAANVLRTMVAVHWHRWFSKRSLAVFLTLEDIDSLRGPEQEYVIDSAISSIAVITRGGLWRSLNGLSLEQEGELRVLAGELVKSWPVLRSYVAVTSRLLKPDSPDQRFHAILHRSAGPVALLVPELKMQIGDAIDDEQRQRLRGYELVSAPTSGISQATPQVLNVVANVALPLTRSDRRLSLTQRNTITAIAAGGLAPLADAYLRFRLSASAVERILCLFDCFEVLIKYSVFAVHSPGDDALLASLARPSLGVWTGALRDRSNSAKAMEGDLAVAISDFWRHPLTGSPRELIDAVKGTGLSWPDRVPRSHLGWLEWLVWLRNRTKGHGSLEETAWLPIWHQFHEALLDTVVGLSPLALHAPLSTVDEDEQPVLLRGWLRGPFRSSTLERDPGSLASINERPSLIYEGRELALDPFVICEGNVCLTWNSGIPGQAEYIDYATGRLQRRTSRLAES